MISISVALTILKPVDDVFKAVLRPVPFFVETASAPLTAGNDILWTFPEMAEGVPVSVEAVVPNESIRFRWDAGTGGKNVCEFRFAALDDEGRQAAAKLGVEGNRPVTVTVTESGWPESEEGRALSYQNNMGWTHMLCSLKAHLEYGVNLRKGSFLHFKWGDKR